MIKKRSRLLTYICSLMVLSILLSGCSDPLLSVEPAQPRETQIITGILSENPADNPDEQSFASVSTTSIKEKLVDVLKEELLEKLPDMHVTGVPDDGEYLITACHDGDTCTIVAGKKTETIRFLNIDASEVDKKDPFSAEARNYLRKLIVKKNVMLEFGLGKDMTGRDKYGRLLAYVTLNDKSVNAMLLERGLARVAYVFEPDTKYVLGFRKTEEIAKNKKLGIWSIPGFSTAKGFDRSVLKKK